jgi:hypothetical protein
MNDDRRQRELAYEKALRDWEGRRKWSWGWERPRAFVTSRTPRPRRRGVALAALTLILVAGGVAAVFALLGPPASQQQTLGQMVPQIRNLNTSLTFENLEAWDPFEVGILSNTYPDARTVYVLLSINRPCENLVVEKLANPAGPLVETPTNGGSGCSFDASGYTAGLNPGETLSQWFFRMRHVAPAYSTATLTVQFAQP